MFLFTVSLMIGTAGLPHVIIRFFTVPKVADARSSAGWALVFIALLYLTAPAVAAMARMNLINTIYPNGIAVRAGRPCEMCPNWVDNWETTGLLTFEDKNGDGLIQYVGDKDANELTVNNDIMVLANPEIAQLPGWVIALVAAGGLAAALVDGGGSVCWRSRRRSVARPDQGSAEPRTSRKRASFWQPGSRWVSRSRWRPIWV